MRLGYVILLSGLGLLALASSLLADDGTARMSQSDLPDTSATMPVSFAGVSTRFDLDRELRVKPDPRKSVLFSIAVPGLGQAENSRWAKASAFVVIGSLLIAKIVVESEKADRCLYLSRNATSDEDAASYYDRYSTHFDRRDRFVWWAVGFWMYNILDAYVDGHLFGFSRQ